MIFLLQEIFGPVLTVYVYPDQKYKETLDLVTELLVVIFLYIFCNFRY